LYTEYQKEWLRLGYGLFIHFGPNTIEGTGWGDGTFPAEKFAFDKIDAGQWARVANDAGMNYAVLTAKHHDGFCLWPSECTEYCVKNSPGRPDVMRMYTEEFRAAGLKTGIYYSLWDRNFAGYEDDALYAEYMKRQLTELLTGYGEISSIFFDGLWDKDHPTREWPYDPKWEGDPDSGLGRGERWRWNELYELIHKLQPGCLVANNSSSDCPGRVKYFPLDYRTCEQMDFIYKGKRHIPLFDPVFSDGGREVWLPLEINASLSPHWFYIEDEFYFHPSAETICGWRRAARDNDANLLINAGPDVTGAIPEYHRYYLNAAAELLGFY